MCTLEQENDMSALLPHNIKTKRDGKQKVEFGPIQIYHFQVALGNSPSVSSGPPICLGALVKQSVTTVNQLAMESVADEWFATEDNKPNTKTSRRREMMLSSDERVSMLLKAGVSRKAIEESAIAAWEARYELMQAIQRRRAKKERSENFRRFFTKIFLRQDEALMSEIKPATTQQATTKVKKPIVRAAMAC